MLEDEADRWRQFAGIRVRYDRHHPAHHVLVDDPRPFPQGRKSCIVNAV